MLITIKSTTHPQYKEQHDKSTKWRNHDSNLLYIAREPAATNTREGRPEWRNARERSWSDYMVGAASIPSVKVLVVFFYFLSLSSSLLFSPPVSSLVSVYSIHLFIQSSHLPIPSLTINSRMGSPKHQGFPHNWKYPKTPHSVKPWPAFSSPCCMPYSVCLLP